MKLFVIFLIHILFFSCKLKHTPKHFDSGEGFVPSADLFLKLVIKDIEKDVLCLEVLKSFCSGTDTLFFKFMTLEKKGSLKEQEKDFKDFRELVLAQFSSKENSSNLVWSIVSKGDSYYIHLSLPEEDEDDPGSNDVEDSLIEEVTTGLLSLGYDRDRLKFYSPVLFKIFWKEDSSINAYKTLESINRNAKTHLSVNKYKLSFVRE